MAPILNLLEVKAKHQLRKESPHPPIKTTLSAYYDSPRRINPTCSKGRCWERPKMGVAWSPSALSQNLYLGWWSLGRASQHPSHPSPQMTRETTVAPGRL